MAAGQCQEAANQRAPHAPSRPEQGQRGAMELLRHTRIYQEPDIQALISLLNCEDVPFSNVFLQSPEHCRRILPDTLHANEDCYIVSK